jgi:SAM-dependent methyltransferase
MTNPLCPITGEPAIRHVQWIKSRSLTRMWKVAHGVDAPELAKVKRFGLWESPTGLFFFDPMVEGSHTFYAQYYAWLLKHNLWTEESLREEFRLAARHVRSGDRVLDVGCGFANFRSVIPPQAHYVGLDPNFAESSCVDGLLKQSLAEHLAGNARTYDVVCAFQVLEHLSSPMAMFADMMQAVRPGGLVIVGVPHVPSALTRIPNFLLNFPPHHLTWWTESALVALGERNGAMIESIEQVPWSPADSLIYWMERCSPFHCTDIHFSNTFSWHTAALIGFLGGRLMYAIRKTPKTTDEGVGLLLVARDRS